MNIQLNGAESRRQARTQGADVGQNTVQGKSVLNNDPFIAPDARGHDEGNRENARDLALRRSDFAGRERYRRKGPLKLGFLTFLSPEGRDPGAGLRDGLTLFEEAEQLGYDLGLIRVRHFQPYPSGPIAFLSAAAQRTSTLRLGTGVIPFHAEDPIRIAEELLTLDILSGGRAEIGIAATTEHRPGILTSWLERDNSKEAVWERIEEFLSHIEGVPLQVEEGAALPGVEDGEPITVTPKSPGLRDRIWGGPGSLASVELTARHRLKLQISSLNTEDVGLRFEPQQYEQIARFRQLSEEIASTRHAEVNVSRNIFPLTGGEDDVLLSELGNFFSDRLYDDGLHRINAFPGFQARYSHPAFGDVDYVSEFLRTDIGLAAADNLIVLVPGKLPVEAQVRLLATVKNVIVAALE